ncbi:HAMP domain-containing sensor histidine kinase [Brevibacterium daeguense]|uniref:histidine kinase n=1 Tax=Brevibacterium daeguense TaxID=909936 RepID=A0ABP8ENX5_9MICO|nr:HAMP domain-containing sensor histidine kinase [Brevibacterium daeguense]
MSPRPQGLASRFLGAQLIVVTMSLLAAAMVATVAGPPLFHEHLELAGVPGPSQEQFHVERAYRDANLITLAVASATGLACAALASFILSRTIRKPLDQITRAAADVAGGRYDVRVPVMGAGIELDALAESFNTMADRLQRTEDTRRRMLSDLAHEMSTPVSVIGVYTEGLQDGVVDWNATTSAVLTEQLTRLTRLIEDLDEVSRAEEGRFDLDRAEVSVADLLTSAAAAMQERYNLERVRLHTAVDPACGVVDVDRQRLAQVLDNLLSNALRHTPSGGTVSLQATCADAAVLIRVADTGEGMTTNQLAHVFERFYRGGTARDRGQGGSGIGLTISRALVEAHDGTLSATSPGPGHGSVFTVALPRSRNG